MRLKLERDRTVIVVVDVQERLAAVMPQETMQRLVKYVRALLGTARELEIPVLATEQYPKGLGSFLPALREMLPQAPLAKMHFSCAADPAFIKALQALGRKQVVLAGMETHVCVFQTARDLALVGFEVQVCADAVSSRTEEHRRVGLELCRQAGSLITTAETAIFDLLHLSGTEEFKAVAPMVK